MYVNTSAFKLRSFKELLHFSPRIVERVWGWFGGFLWGGLGGGLSGGLNSGRVWVWGSLEPYKYVGPIFGVSAQCFGI
jgi:hypothetical protein